MKMSDMKGGIRQLDEYEEMIVKEIVDFVIIGVNPATFCDNSLDNGSYRYCLNIVKRLHIKTSLPGYKA